MSGKPNSQNDEILAAIVRDSDDAIFSMTRDGMISSWNSGAERMYGYSADEIVGKPASILVPINLRDESSSVMARIKVGESVNQYETVRKHKDGHSIDVALTVSPIRNRQGRIVGASTIARDITAQREAKRDWERMSHLAYHDPVTGLPNRVLFNDRLSQVMSTARRHGDKFAVVFADLNNFKSVNDRLGHAVGDALLQAVASSLVACLRSNDTVSRHGGDEFVMLLTEIKDASDASKAVQKITTSIENVRKVGPHELKVEASIGISIYPDHGHTGEVLLHKADAAMYRAKRNRGVKYAFAA